MEQYYISGIWTSVVGGRSLITHVMLHQSHTDKMFGKGKKTSLENIVKLLRNRSASILTIEWSYKFNEWQKGSEVDFETMDNLEYLRTKRGDKLFDNLNSLLPMNVLMVN